MCNSDLDDEESDASTEIPVAAAGTKVYDITEFDVFDGNYPVQKRHLVNKLLPVLDEFESGTDQQKFNLATDIINQVEALHETENGVMVRGRYVYNL